MASNRMICRMICRKLRDFADLVRPYCLSSRPKPSLLSLSLYIYTHILNGFCYYNEYQYIIILMIIIISSSSSSSSSS